MFFDYEPKREKLPKEQETWLNNLVKLTAEDILAIPDTSAGTLFKFNNLDFVNLAYKKLALIWHPDKNSSPHASDVFARINDLQEAALRDITKGIWNEANVVRLATNEGKELVIPYIQAREFELGKYYLTNNSIVYLVSNSASDLFDNAVNNIKSLKFPDAATAAGLKTWLPEIKQIHTTADYKILILKKDPNLILLRDVLSMPEHNGKIDPFHVAWILSRLHNLACYFKWANFSHQAITLDTCFIEPRGHGLTLLGGWWYSSPVQQPILGLPGYLAKFMPSVVNSGLAQASTDLNLTRMLCCQLLGNPAGHGYFTNPEVPPAMLNWLLQPNANEPLEQYRQWKDQIRPALFTDKPGLIPMPVAVQQVYPRVTLT